jgi:hypothetical protein
VPLLRPLPPAQAPEGVLWAGEARELITAGNILPFISNYLLARAFDGDASAVATSWASEINSPLPDTYNGDLARVAQYYSVCHGAREAKRAYHDFLKRFLLGNVQGGVSDHDPHYASVDQSYMDSLTDVDASGERVPNAKFNKASFSELVEGLTYPAVPAERDSMRLLAQLPLSVYLTTSQHQFLEQALKRTPPKDPVTEIFYWDESLYGIESIFNKEPSYRPSPQRPLVYHLFGVDKDPASLVISEDDYVNVLIRLSQLKTLTKTGEFNFDIPAEIKQKLSSAGLLLLGYDINDWDFRVLFRWLVNYVGGSRQGFGHNVPEAVCMQVRPTMETIAEQHRNAIETYLTDFFRKNLFSVYWGDPDSCVNELWQRYTS